VKNPEHRLGYKLDGKEIKAHPWLNDVNWDDLENRKIQAPFIPDLKSKSDISYF
jgi:hypothetical protein